MSHVTTKAGGTKEQSELWETLDVCHLDGDDGLADAFSHSLSLICPYKIHAALEIHDSSTKMLEIRQAESNLVLF